MDNQPLFSIITVSFNNGKTIADTIQSVLRQSFTNFEYLIIDGGSSDETQEILSRLPAQVRWISEPDKGIYDAMNKGWKLASGRFVAYLNADDLYDNPQVLEKVAATITSFPDARAVYGDLAYVKANQTTRVVRYWKSGRFEPYDFLWGWMPPHPTFFLEKNAFVQWGGFRDEELRSAADYELMLRMLFVHKIPTAYCPHLLVRMRTGGESNKSLKNRVRGNKEDRKAWELNGIKPGLFTLICKPLRKIPQYWQKPKN